MTIRVLTPKGGILENNSNVTETKKRWLPHINGLRGLAIFLVVIFHVFVGKVSSGVDVFLVMGGILLLSSQMNNASNEEGIGYLQSIIRMLRRLVPALLVMIISTSILSIIFSPPASWSITLNDASASILYFMNLRLIGLSQDYASAGADVSPLQHLWSMSVQMQVYVTIMTVIFLIFSLMRVRKNSQREKYARFIVVTIFSAATASSFAYACFLHSVNQGENYYSPLSRMWEIGIGGLLGLILYKHEEIPTWIRWILSTIGLSSILLTGIFLDGASQFPGIWALIPVVGALCVVLSGSTEKERTWSQLGLTRALETKPLLFLGNISYSLYLWHWPLLIIGMNIFGIENSPIYGVVIIFLSLVLAWLSYSFIEKPFQQRVKPSYHSIIDMLNGSYIKYARRNSFVKMPIFSVITIMSLFSLVALSPLIMSGYNSYQVYKVDNYISALGGKEYAYPGARAVTDGVYSPPDLPLYPNPLEQSEMMPATTYDECYSPFDNVDIVLFDKDGNPCSYGDTYSSETLYIIGGSHSEMFLPALDEIGKNRGIKIVPIIKMGCALFYPTRWNGEDYPQCYQDWSPKAMEYILNNPPTVGVLHTTTRPEGISGAGLEVVPEYYEHALTELSQAGIHIFGVRDVPWFTDGQYGGQKEPRLCLSEGKNINECSQPSSWSLYPENPAVSHYQGIPPEDITHIDITQTLIQDGSVRPVVGNILTYRDSHHLTSQFAETLTDELDRQMFP